MRKPITNGGRKINQKSGGAAFEPASRTPALLAVMSTSPDPVFPGVGTLSECKALCSVHYFVSLSLHAKIFDLPAIRPNQKPQICALLSEQFFQRSVSESVQQKAAIGAMPTLHGHLHSQQRFDGALFHICHA